MQRPSVKTHLSKLTLEMRFMKKSKDRIEKEKEAEEGRAMYANEITEEMLKGSSQYISQKSIIPCKDLIEGRLSFLGMNPEIEKLMQEKITQKRIKEEESKEADVSDRDMAKRYNGLVSTMGRKFDKRRNRGPKIKSEPPEKKKLKFLKPVDT